jgi:hypothetical protein
VASEPAPTLVGRSTSPELKIPIYTDPFGKLFTLETTRGALNLISWERARCVDGPSIF